MYGQGSSCFTSTATVGRSEHDSTPSGAQSHGTIIHEAPNTEEVARSAKRQVLGMQIVLPRTNFSPFSKPPHSCGVGSGTISSWPDDHEHQFTKLVEAFINYQTQLEL